MKANPHPELLRAAARAGHRVRVRVAAAKSSGCSRCSPTSAPQRVLFTPNFAPRAEYAWALARGVRVTVDNSFVLDAWP